MSRPYIMRKGVSRLNDLVDGAVAKLPPGHAEVYYVNGVTWANGYTAGSDANSGLSMDDPLHTFTKALSLCTDGGNDVIVALDCWAATGETWPIAVNKDLVSIIGVGSQPVGKWAQLYSAADVCMDITANNVYISGFGFTPVSTSPCVTFDGGCANVWLDSCQYNSGVQGILLATADMQMCLAITNSTFHSALTVGGILIDDDVTQLYIANNIFKRLTGVSIDITSANDGVIIDNMFALKANTEGLAITLATSVSEFFVNGNDSAYGTATTTSPYKDEGTDTTNNWGRNFLGGTAIAAA